MNLKSFSHSFTIGLFGGCLLAGCAMESDGDFTADIGQTQAPLIVADAATAIAGEYIVVFKEGTKSASMNAAMNRLSFTSANSHIKRTYSIIPAFNATLDSDALAQIRRDPNVAFVEQDGVISLDAVTPSPADGIDRVDQRQGRDGLYDDYGNDGAGVHVYIIDTGIRSSHQEFTGRMGNGATAINDGNGAEDCHGHGTHVASTAAGTEFGIAKAATLHAVRVLDCNGSGSFSGVIAGVDFVAADCANQGRTCVANMSLGGGASSSVDDAVNNAVASGVTFAVAAGNSNADACGFSPARAASALTVGATEDNDDRASFSNFGACVDLFAPGRTILGAWIGSDTDTNTISGTSMASPHVAGVAAQYLGLNPTASPSAVEAALEGIAATNCVADANGSPNLFLHNDFAAAPFDCNGNQPPQPDPNSCYGFCDGRAPAGCWCDYWCAFYNDCCSDKFDECGSY